MIRSTLLFLCAVALGQSQDLESLRRGFDQPPADARIMMRWWWYGAGVDKHELEAEMLKMKEGGIGGFEVQPVYPLELDDPGKNFRNLPYLSNDYLDALRFTSEKARELGLRMDITLGSGWPFGGPHIGVTEAAGRLRCDRVAVPTKQNSLPMPAISNGEKLLAIFLAKGDEKRFEPTGITRINTIEHGRLQLPPSITGPHVVLFFIASRTGQQVKRPALGAEGFVLDHYSRAAIDHHLKVVGEPLLKAFGANPPYAVFSDSLEVYNSDWTDDLPQEFQRRRGYDIIPYLPALIGDMGLKTADVRHDWGLTLSELCEERYLKPIRDWAASHNTKFRSQTYGVPPVTLSSNNLVDLPEGEGASWRKFTSTRWATSASHLYGKQVTSSETWTWLHSPVFRATPLDMKAEADMHFLQGVNQLIGHGWPYSPEIAGEPGWRFYAAAVFNHHNPWWLVMPDVTQYLQRISYLLRQGKPANDVALYLPTADAFSHFVIGKTSVDKPMDELYDEKLIPSILDAGYNFDLIDDAAIQNLGISHPILFLPKLTRMPPATSRKLEEFKNKGGKVVTDTDQLTKALQPDFAAGNDAIGFIHRKLDSSDIYFTANTSNKPVDATVRIRTKATSAEWWDAATGKVTGADLKAGSIVLHLEPYESRVLVLSTSPARPAESIRTSAKLDIATGWKVSFQGVNHVVAMNQLRSWTNDEQTRYFSGQATYEKTVVVPDGMVKSRLFLDFGPGKPFADPSSAMGFKVDFESPVREAALVFINDKRAGAVWKAPFEVEVTGFITDGNNQVRIVVANLAINGMAGQKMPDYKLLNLRFGERFQPQDLKNLEPLPSGILGGVSLGSR